MLKNFLSFKALKISLATSSVSVPIFFLTSLPKKSHLDNMSLSSSEISDNNGKNILKIGDESKEITSILKDYLKTYSGAENFSKKFSEIYTHNFLESLKNEKYRQSSLKNKYLNILSEVNDDIEKEWNKLAEPKQEEKLKMFAGKKENYKYHESLDKIKNKFLNLLTSENTLNIDGIEDLKEEKVKEQKEKITVLKTFDKTKSSKKPRSKREASAASKGENKISFINTKTPDSLKKEISFFMQYAFEDFLIYERPIPFQKLTWKYDTSKESKNFKKYLSIEKGLKKLPESPDYYFPAFSDETESKFKKFLNKVKEPKKDNGSESSKYGIDNENLTEYSDVEKHYFTIPISSLYKSEYSSQFIIALLNFYSNFITRYIYEKNDDYYNAPKEWNGILNFFSLLGDAVKYKFDELKEKIANAFSSVSDTFEMIKIKITSENANIHCAYESTNETLQNAKWPIYDETNGMLLSLFCLNKIELDSLYKPNAKISDFVVMETQKTNENKKHVDEKWFFFRDRDGVHAITKEHKLGRSNDLEQIQKVLLLQEYERKNNHTNAKRYDFDLFTALKKHIKNHFDRLMIEFYDKFSEPEKQEEKKKQENNKEYEETIEELKKFLLANYYGKNLFEIKKSIIKDYAPTVKTLPYKDKKIVNRERRSAEKTVEEEKILNPSIGYAGSFPYSINYSDNKDPYYKEELSQQVQNGKTTEETNSEVKRRFLIDILEKLYLRTEIYYEQKEKHDKKQKIKEKQELKKPEFKEEPQTSHLTPNIKKISESYKTKIDSLFTKNSEKLKTENKNYKNKKTIHFKTEESKDDKNKLIPEISELMENIWVSALNNKSIENSLIQEQLKKVIEKYFEFDKNQYKESENIDNQTTLSLFKNSNNNGNSLIKELVKNYLIYENLDLYTKSPLPHIFGDWNYEKGKEDNSFYELFKSINYEKNYINSTDGVDLISEKNQNIFWDMFTIHWLSKNKFENFRLYLKKHIKEDSFNAFLFFQKYEKEKYEICKLKNSELSKDDLEDFGFKKNINNVIYNPYIFKQKEDNKSNWNECGSFSDNYSFARIIFEDANQKSDSRKKRQVQAEDNSKILTGYRGLINEDYKDIPEEIMRKIMEKKVMWKNLNSIIQKIKGSKTFKELEKVIEQLKKQFDDIEWSFISLQEKIKPKNFNFNWRSNNSNFIELKQESISLQEKKQILINYLKNQIQLKIDKNVSWTYIEEKQKEFLINKGNKKGNNNLISEEKFKNFTGSISEVSEDNEEAKNYLLTDSENNTYKIFLIQIKHDDFTTSKNFEELLKRIHSDLLLKEVIKIAQDENVQKQAIWEELFKSKDKDENLKTIEIYDERVRSSLSENWSIK